MQSGEKTKPKNKKKSRFKPLSGKFTEVANKTFIFFPPRFGGAQISPWGAPLRPALPCQPKPSRGRHAAAPFPAGLEIKAQRREGEAKAEVRYQSQPRTRPARRETSSASPHLPSPRKDPPQRKTGPPQPPLDPFHLPQPGELGISNLVAQITTRKASDGLGQPLLSAWLSRT